MVSNCCICVVCGGINGVGLLHGCPLFVLIANRFYPSLTSIGNFLERICDMKKGKLRPSNKFIPWGHQVLCACFGL